MITSLAAIGLLTFLLYKFLIYPTFVSPLATIPNAHHLSAITGWWWKRQQKNFRELKTLYAAHQRHGPVVRMGANEVSIASPEGLREIYTAGLEKSSFYAEFANFGTPNMVSMMDHRSHAVQKRAISNVYSKSYLMHSPDMATLCRVITRNRFLPFLEANKDTDVNVMALGQWAGMDLMCSYLFGLQNATNLLQDKEAREHYFAGYVSLLDLTPEIKTRLETECMKMCRAALTDSQTNPSNANTDTERTNPIVFAKLHSEIATSKKTSINPGTPLERTASEMMDHIFAAQEGMGVTITYLLYRITLSPTIQTALRKELLTLETPVTTHGQTSIPSPAALDALPLLNGVVQETLRMHAAAPGRQPRVAPKEGFNVHGFEIPGGTVVSCNAYTLHRNEEIFPNAEEFLPQRWIEGSGGKGEVSQESMRRWFWAFGSGGRMCVGNHFALQVMKLLLAAMYTNYTTSIVDDTGIEQLDAFISGPVGGKLILKFHEVDAAGA